MNTMHHLIGKIFNLSSKLLNVLNDTTQLNNKVKIFYFKLFFSYISYIFNQKKKKQTNSCRDSQNTYFFERSLSPPTNSKHYNKMISRDRVNGLQGIHAINLNIDLKI